MAAVAVPSAPPTLQGCALQPCPSGFLGADGGMPAALSLGEQLRALQRRSGGGGAGHAAPPAALGRCAAPAAPAAAGRWQQQQQHAEAPRRRHPRGCLHCLACLDLPTYCNSAAAAVAARRSSGRAAPAPEEWWPSGLSSPTLYFQLRRRQLHIQYKASATAVAAAKLWRPVAQTQAQPSELLCRRVCRPLGLLIPTTYTNIQQSDARVQLVGVKDAPRWLSAAAPPAAAAPAAAANRKLQALLCCSGDDLPLRPRDAAPAAHVLQGQRTSSLPSPAKRTRLFEPRLDVHAAVGGVLHASPFAAAAQQQPPQQAQQQSVAQQPPTWWVQHSAAAPGLCQPAAPAPAQPAATQPWWVASAAAPSAPAALMPPLCSAASSQLATPDCATSLSSYSSEGTLPLVSARSATSVLPPPPAPTVLEYQRAAAIKAERAFPVAIDMPSADAEAAPSVASALASLLRLLKRKAD